MPDSYHTLYSLAGLSTAQHNVIKKFEAAEKLSESWKGDDDIRKVAFLQARSWVEEEGTSKFLNGAGDRVESV